MEIDILRDLVIKLFQVDYSKSNGDKYNIYIPKSSFEKFHNLVNEYNEERGYSAIPSDDLTDNTNSTFTTYRIYGIGELNIFEGQDKQFIFHKVN